MAGVQDSEEGDSSRERWHDGSIPARSYSRREGEVPGRRRRWASSAEARGDRGDNNCSLEPLLFYVPPLFRCCQMGE